MNKAIAMVDHPDRSDSLHSVGVIVLAKFPTAGRVKTRLTPAIPTSVAASVHRCFLLHLVRRIQSLKPAELIVYFDPPDAQELMRTLLAHLEPLTFMPQVAGDLGVRIGHALDIVGKRHSRTLLLAVDSPDVPRQHILNCARATADAQVVLGLAEDGGYWCIGSRNDVDAGALLSKDIAWSTDRTAADTIAQAQKLGYSTWTGESWDDVDQPADLIRLLGRLSISAQDDNRELYRELTAILPEEFLSRARPQIRTAIPAL
jgi:rSAM/selenodomain-associated transferase 1